MDISKLKPWNWFRKEEEEASRDLPVRRSSTDVYPPLTDLHAEVDRFFDETFRRFGLPSIFRGDLPGQPGRAGSLLRPRVDISAKAKEYVLTVEVPGIEEKDVSLELANDTLTIRGEKKREQEEKDQNYYCIERSYGSFQRVLSLPEDADQSKIAARFRNGVLTVTMPRRPEKKKDVRTIDIERG